MVEKWEEEEEDLELGATPDPGAASPLTRLQSEGPALVRGTSPHSLRSDHLHRPGSHQQSHCPHKDSTDRGTSRRSDHIAASPNLGPKCLSESFPCVSLEKKTKGNNKI